jgi:hypothetical protein
MLNTMDFKKTALHITGMLLAIGVPISLFSTANLMSGGNKSSTSPTVAVPALPEPTAGDGSTPLSTPRADAWSHGSRAENMPLPSLSEVLRFDVTVEWVLRRWPRVSTGLPYLQLQGYRVPLVTGTGLSDVAGSLTYYFNAQQQVQRITLRGTTGDPSVLVSLVTSRHQFTRRLTNDPGVVVYEAVDWRNRSAGSLQIRSAKVVTANQPYMWFEVDLVMDRAE